MVSLVLAKPLERRVSATFELAFSFLPHAANYNPKRQALFMGANTVANVHTSRIRWQTVHLIDVCIRYIYLYSLLTRNVSSSPLLGQNSASSSTTRVHAASA